VSSVRARVSRYRSLTSCDTSARRSRSANATSHRQPYQRPFLGFRRCDGRPEILPGVPS
jgi:hypothetical protein